MKELNVEGLNKTFGIDGPSVIILEESDYELIQEPDTWFTKLPRCNWKTKRYWWNNGVDETLQEECPPGWKRGRAMTEEHQNKFKSKKGRQKGIPKNTNRRRDSKGRLLSNK